MKHYYEAYEDRYQTIHALGHAWSSDRPTPIVGEVLARYGVPKTAALTREIKQADLTPLETGLTPSPPDFDRLLYAVVSPTRP